MPGGSSVRSYPHAMERDELASWLRLCLTDGVGPVTARRLLASFGLPHTLFAQPRSALLAHTSPAQADALSTPPSGLDGLLQTTWAWLNDPPANGPHRSIVTLGDARYPASLLEAPDPPLMLYVLGPAPLLQGNPFPTTRCLAMVGSRNPTGQGRENAHQFAQHLRQAGWCIVSGLALGVDAAAHDGALDAADSDPHTPATIAVVGTGLDRVYPRRNLELAHRIAQSGLVVSEYPLGTPPLASNFPKRNRIIAGLAQGTLVVEAAPASGSLITARLANEMGREVFAIPGSIHAVQSRGCHTLIRQGAKLVESAQDILEELAPWSTPAKTATAATEAPAQKPHRYAVLLDALGFDPMGLDGLQARTGLDTPTLQVQLLELELEGLVTRLQGGLFQRMAST